MSSFSFHILVSLLTGFILVFCLFSLYIKERLYLTESLVATLFGIIISVAKIPFPFLTDIKSKNLEEKDRAMFFICEFTRFIICFQVMAIGISTPLSFLKKEWKSFLIILGPLMIGMWFISAFIFWAVFKIEILDSLIIAACITPTDPILAHSVIKGKFSDRYIPQHIKNLLSIESGINDGLGLFFLLLPLFFKTKQNKNFFFFVLNLVLLEIGGAILVGILIGIISKKLLFFSRKLKLIDKDSFLVFSLVLSIFVMAIANLLHIDDFIAVFITGFVFSNDESFLEEIHDSQIQEIIDMIFNILFFIFFGALFPFESFNTKEISLWKMILCSCLILVFRRLPLMFILKKYVPILKTNKETFFAGWFGPIGVGAIFFSTKIWQEYTFVSKKIPIYKENAQKTFSIVCFIVLSSIIVHGITVPITNTHLKKRAKRKIKKKTLKEIVKNVEEFNEDDTGIFETEYNTIVEDDVYDVNV